MSRRRGITLVEMMVVVASTATLITLCAVTIRGVMQAERSARRDGAEVAALDRLAAAFRRDARAATAPPGGVTPARLLLELPEGRAVEYRVADGAVVATRTAPGQRSPRIETFRPRRWAAVRLDLDEESGRPLARLVFRPAARPGEVELPIEAVVGRGVSP